MNVTWLPINKDTLYYLNISNELSIGTNPDSEKMEFWGNLYSKYYKIWDHPKPNIVSALIQENSEVNSCEAFHSEIIVKETIITTLESEMVSKEIDQSIDNEVKDLQEEKEIHREEEPPSQTEKETTVEVVTEEIKEAEVPDSVDSVVKTVEIREYAEVNPTEHNLVHQNGDAMKFNGNIERKPRPSNEIKMVQPNNINPKDVIRANDPPEDDLPKNIGVNKFVNFFESLGAKK